MDKGTLFILSTYAVWMAGMKPHVPSNCSFD